jgi:hypothetical protein
VMDDTRSGDANADAGNASIPRTENVATVALRRCPDAAIGTATCQPLERIAYAPRRSRREIAAWGRFGLRTCGSFLSERRLGALYTVFF